MLFYINICIPLITSQASIHDLLEVCMVKECYDNLCL